MNPNILIINSKDNVAIALEDIPQGGTIKLPDGTELPALVDIGDINAGVVLQGGTLDDVGKSIMDLIERVIAGEQTRAESNKQNGILAVYTQTTSF